MNHKAIRAIYPQVVIVDDTAGAFDKDLIEKIFKFQEVNKLTPDGVAGPDTIEKLPKLPVGENKILEFLFKFTDEVENELV